MAAGGRSKVRRGAVRWSRAKRRDFLDQLAATCNVREAAAAIGVDVRSVYRLRQRDPAFVEEWENALRLGYQMLETRLVGHALAGRGAGEPLAREALPPIDPELAMTLLTAHRKAMEGAVHRGGRRPSRASEAETNAALMKKLDAVERSMRGDAA